MKEEADEEASRIPPASSMAPGPSSGMAGAPPAESVWTAGNRMLKHGFERDSLERAGFVQRPAALAAEIAAKGWENPGLGQCLWGLEFLQHPSCEILQPRARAWL